MTLLTAKRGPGSAAVAGFATGDPRTYTPYLGYAARLETPVADNTALTQLTDQSGNTRHATQATSGSRGKYRTNQVNGQPAFEFDGTDDNFSLTTDLSGTNKVTILSVVKPTTSASFRNLIEYTADSTAAASGGFMINHESTNVFTALLRGNVGQNSHVSDVTWSNAWHYAAAVFDMSLGFAEALAYLDGILVNSTQGLQNNTGNFAASSLLSIGSRNGGASRFWLGQIGDLWVIPDALTQQQLADVGSYFNSVYATAYAIWHPANATTVIDDTYNAEPYNAQHRMGATTDATRIHWETATDMYGISLGGAAESLLRVSGRGWAIGNHNTDSLGHFTGPALPSGTKDVDVIAGFATRVNDTGTVHGTQIRGIAAPSTASWTPLTESGPLWVVYGDSIAVGDVTSAAPLESWGARLRREHERLNSGHVRFEGWGYRTLWSDGETQGQIDALAARLATGSPSRIYVAIGTNDYGLARPSVLPATWNHTTFGTAAGQLMVAINALVPSCQQYWITPIGRGSEGAVNGSTLPNYRTAITTAASGKSYVTTIDGKTILDPLTPNLETAEMEGGSVVHPISRGHATYFGRLAKAIGFSYWQYSDLSVDFSSMPLSEVTALTDATPVTRINDASGRKIHAKQTTSGAQPKFYKNQLNGHAEIRVDGGDGMTSDNTLDATGTSGITVYTIAKFVSGDIGTILEFGADYSASTVAFRIKHNSDNTITAELIGDVGASDFTTTGTVTAYALISVVLDKSQSSNEVTIWLNGATAAGTRTNNSNNTNAFGNLALNWFSRNNASGNFMAATSAIVRNQVYLTAHDTTKRQAIEQALCTQYGLTWLG